MFDGRWRTGVDRVTTPMAATMRRTGITADHLTGAGLVLGAATAVAIGSGRLGVGLVLLICAALLDLFDGPVAKASGTSGPRGAFFDSVSDRVTDALVLGGIAWYLASEHAGHLALLPFAVLASSALISYERAKAESLGYVAKGGLMERAERIIALCFGLFVSALLVPVLWIMLVLTLATAAQRFVKVWRQAEVVIAPVPPPQPMRPAMEARWRAWRESTSVRAGRPRRHAWGSRAGRSRSARGEKPWRRRAGTRP
ncbi:MAG TPA: CDP-alcohol phosphatidyltransferase family protein [Acidimicrobiales bacterium]|nr:CDP-alcohol phosphatidyltransferase family protein [Acidimicrobiales bacterium]